MFKNTANLKTLVTPLRTHLIFVAVFSAFYNLLFLAPSLYMMQVYDRVLTTGGMNTLALLSVLLLAALATLALLDRVRSAILLRASLRLEKAWSQSVIRAMMNPAAPAEGSSALRDFDQVRQVVTGPAITAISDAPWAPLYIFCAFLIHPALGAVAAVGAVILLILAIMSERAASKAMQATMSEMRTHYAAQDHSAAAADAVRVMGMTEPLARMRAEERVGFINRQARGQMAGGGYLAATRFLRLVLQSTSIGLGGYLAVQGLMSPGGIIAASIMLSRALMPVEQLVQAWRPLLAARDSINSIFKVLTAAHEADRERMPLPKPEGVVTGQAIQVHHDNRAILNGVDFQLEPGEIVGVLGASGAGKTTLARIIAGASNPTGGLMRLDGATFDDWGHERLAQSIGYLPQSPSLLPGTVGDNISCFQTRIDELDKEEVGQAVIEAAEIAGVHDMIQMQLPNGYDTPLGPSGLGLSAGQAQRIGLARAVYGNPAVIVLDEPNAHLDANGEAKLINALKLMRDKGSTVLVVAHRRGVLDICDKLMVIGNGAIEHFGPRLEVVRALAQARQAGQTQKPANINIAAGGNVIAHPRGGNGQ